MVAKFDPTMIEAIYETGDLPLLGYTAFWRVEDCEMRRDALELLLHGRGFGQFAPGEATHRNALRDAIEEWLTDQGKTRTKRVRSSRTTTRSRIDIINDWDDAFMCFVVTTQEADLARFGLHHSTELRIFLNKKTGDMFCTLSAEGWANANAQQDRERAITREIGALYSKHRDMLTSAEVGRVIGNIVDTLGAVSLRANGGVYFIPVAQRASVDSLRGLCADITSEARARKGDAFFLASPVINIGDVRQQFAHVAHRAFEGEIATLERALNDMLEREAGTVGSGTVIKAINEYQALKVKAEAYGDLLGMRQEKITAAVARLTERARTVVLRGSGVESPPTPADGQEPLSEAA